MIRAMLGDLERAVLEALWEYPEGEWATVRDVYERLNESRDLAYTTVMTVMGRLAKKGLAVRRRAGRAFDYRPAASRDELTATFMHQTLDELTPEHRQGVLMAFVDDANAEEREALRQALRELESSQESSD